MHYYKFNIGDYQSHTKHLSPIEDICYRRLLDFYYLHEQPIPKDLTKVAKLLLLKEYEKEIGLVLSEFFVKSKAGWINPRADEEIQQYQGFKQSGKDGAAKRWAKAPYSPPIDTLIANNNQETQNNKQEIYIEILNYLNKKAKRNYRPVKVNLDLIKARLDEGYTKDDIIKVIDAKCASWLSDNKMKEYLRPETLFNRTKLAQYTGEGDNSSSNDWLKGLRISE